MSAHVSSTVPARHHQSGGIFSVHSIDLDRLGGLASPLALLDDFRVSGKPFGPHPHAGFSAITYVFEESPTALRSRDSLGNDLIVRPGGIVWLQSGRGAQHQEVPAVDGGVLHGAQIYVNLTARNKLTPPRTLHLQPDQVPEWRNGSGDRVRVLVGRFGHVVSALAPIEPYTIWDVHVSSVVDLPVAAGDNTVIYSLSGAIELEVDGKSVPVAARSAIAFTGSRSAKVGSRDGLAHLLVMSGAGIAEPVFMDGPFIMNDDAGVRAAVSRFRTGQMGFLEPV